MWWGFLCGDGWFDLVDTLCAGLQSLTDNAGAPQIVAVQVKEKFGGLRFYVLGASGGQRELISAAELESRNICDVCGQPGKVVDLDGYYSAKCGEHAKR